MSPNIERVGLEKLAYDNNMSHTFFKLPCFIGLVLVLASSAAHAQLPGQSLAQQRQCLSCHQVDSQRVGPPFRSIAQRYGNGPHDAIVDYLARSIMQGGRGRWGAVPMPAQPQVSQADAQALASWILSLNSSK